MIRNPYANKKRKTPFSSVEAPTRRLEDNDVVTASHASVADCGFVRTSSSEDDSIPKDKCDVAREESSNVYTKENEKSSYSNDVHYGQRLPSQRLTFGSAVVLTVPEVLHHFHSATLPLAENKEIHTSLSSIRVTGVVLHQHVHSIPDLEDTVVSILLGDPILPPTTAASTPQYPRSRPSLVSFAATPTHLSPLSAPRHPIPDSTGTTASTVTAPKTDTQKKKIVPILVYRKKTTSSLLSTGRRLSFAENSGHRKSGPIRGRVQPPSSLEQLVQRLDGTKACVWILVRLATTTVLGSMQKNDLVTVFGELPKIDVSGTSGDTDAVTSAIQQVRSLRRCDDAGRAGCIQARIVRNANGTNMKLFTEALFARRRLLEP